MQSELSIKAQEVNLTKGQMDLLLHTLGLNYQDTAFRNHFVASEGHSDFGHLKFMENAGLLECRPSPFGDDGWYFFATESGKSIAMDHHKTIVENRPKPTRYQEYLRSECDEKFHEWLGIELPQPEYSRGLVRVGTSKAKGEWKQTLKEAKASYKEARKIKPKEACLQ